MLMSQQIALQAALVSPHRPLRQAIRLRRPVWVSFALRELSILVYPSWA